VGIFASLPAVAQERFGSIGGTITDTTKAAVPGATITVTNKQNGAVRTAVSEREGTFRVPDLPPGRYTVTIELQGFQTPTSTTSSCCSDARPPSTTSSQRAP